MLNILKARIERAEQAERKARLIGLRRQDTSFSPDALVPMVGWNSLPGATDIPLHHIAAVYAKESRGLGFDETGRLIVLYEPHVAYKNARRPKEAAARAPKLFYRSWIDPKDVPRSQWHAYRTTQEQRWEMIGEAADIDFEAAIDAVSWGRFQVMGYWAEKLGFRDTLHMIEHMYEGEHNHLDVFLRYCRMDGLLPALKRGDWYAFSRYNSRIESVRRKYAADLAREADKAKGMLA